MFTISLLYQECPGGDGEWSIDWKRSIGRSNISKKARIRTQTHARTHIHTHTHAHSRRESALISGHTSPRISLINSHYRGFLFSRLPTAFYYLVLIVPLCKHYSGYQLIFSLSFPLIRLDPERYHSRLASRTTQIRRVDPDSPVSRRADYKRSLWKGLEDARCLE